VGNAGDLFAVRHSERRRSQVLPGVRLAPGGDLPELRIAESAGCEILRRVCDAISRSGDARSGSRANGAGLSHGLRR